MRVRSLHASLHEGLPWRRVCGTLRGAQTRRPRALTPGQIERPGRCRRRGRRVPRHPVSLGNADRAIHEMRTDYPMWDKSRITALLRREGGTVSQSTVGHILEKPMDRGAVLPVPTLRRAAPRRAPQADPTPNACPRDADPQDPAKSSSSTCSPSTPVADAPHSLDAWSDAFADEFDTLGAQQALAGPTPARYLAKQTAKDDPPPSHMSRTRTGGCPVAAASIGWLPLREAAYGRSATMDGLEARAARGRAVAVALAEARIHGEWRREPVAGRPTCVFLHDGLGSTETMRDLPERLGGALGTGAFVYDRWGYGRSDRRDAFPRYFMEDEAERLPRVLAAAGIDACYLIGHSDGGTIALLHAAADPAGLRATVSIAAHVFLDPLTRSQLARHQKMLDDGTVPGFMHRFHGERGPHLLRCWTRMHRDPGFAGWDITSRIARIRGPLLSIQGAEDAYGTPEQIAAIERAVPHAVTMLLADLGHFPHLEAPERIAAILADFLTPHCTPERSR